MSDTPHTQFASTSPRRRSLPAIPLRTLLPLGLTAAFVLAALFAGAIAPYDPNQQQLADFLLPPSATHLMGTDTLGRDVFSRIIFGSRVSLIVGVLSVGLAGALGVTLGMVAAMARGWVGEVIMRLTDLVLAVPAVLVALAVAATIGPSLTNVVLLIGLLYWAQFSRMVFSEAAAIQQSDYVQSAYAIGCGPTQILWRHVLPNLINTVIVLATLQVATAILLEATLSFLGVGVPPPTPSWGVMVAEARSYVELGWWAVTFPGGAIMLAVLAINLLGDDLRDRLDPRSARRR
jgi:peptide/nickel transport system permease protein